MMNLNQLLSYSPTPQIAEHQLIKAAEKLRLILTQKRSELKNYVLDDELVTAYIVFYFSSNISKWSLLEKLPIDLKTHWKDATVLDFGTGPGTYLYSFSRWMGQIFTGKLIGVDQSELMLKAARKIMGDSCKLQNRLGSEKADLLIFGNSANEMQTKELFNIVKQSECKEVLFFEPGDKATFRLMLDIRAQLLSQGFQVIYPCNSSAVCPLAHIDDWCHQYAIHSPEISVERLMQKLNWDRRKLPMIMHLYSKRLPPMTEKVIQRSLPVKKFGKPIVVCDNGELKQSIIKKDQLKELGEDCFKEGQLIS